MRDAFRIHAMQHDMWALQRPLSHLFTGVNRVFFNLYASSHDGLIEHSRMFRQRQISAHSEFILAWLTSPRNPWELNA